MKIRAIITVGLVLLLFHTGIAQTSPIDERCATMEQDRLNRIKYPEFGSLDKFEERVQRRVVELLEEMKAGRTQALVLSIPIVVHVVHNGEAVGTGPNLSAAQIASQIEVLNEDFRRVAGTPGFNDHPAGADIEIEFCLSPVDDKGNLLDEPGIHRYNGNQPDWSREEIENRLKPSTYWNPNLFYNIWTVRFDASASTLIGYAQFPDQSGLAGLQERGGPATTDGVVVRYQAFGSIDKGSFPALQAPHNRGRTLTHETGHWLGLRHIWGDGACADDFVGDTPPAAGPSYGCQVGRVSCGGINMVENYMDYSDDACMNIFTEGQKLRMRAVMDISPRRKSLVESSLCSPVVDAPPVASIGTGNLNCVLLGSEVQFTDLSTNFPNQWLWTFEGGDPTTSTARNPAVTYHSPGTFDVQLIVSNTLGADTLLLDDFITISEEGLCGEFQNFEGDFTPSVLPLSAFGNYTGHLTGHNSARSNAFSEFFLNECGYAYISGVDIRFDQLNLATEDARLFVTVWNARGPQSSPGSVIERKEVLLKQIQNDIASGQPTHIVFDRETPLFSRAFHVGVEIEYDEGYEVAIVSSANGEATQATSWVRHHSDWELFTIQFGANIAMDIRPAVGVHPSVQVSASKQLINPGEQVTLNARGASVFIWSADDGSLENVPGPQLIVRPTKQTTYTTTGSGVDLCHTQTHTTIYMRSGGVVSVDAEKPGDAITVFPNPGTDNIHVRIDTRYTGDAEIHVYSAVGLQVGQSWRAEKPSQPVDAILDASSLPPGIYLISVRTGKQQVMLKWIKQ